VIEPRSIPRRAERTAARVVAGRALVVVLDDRALHSLNEVGTRVWELCDGRTVAAIAETLANEFEVDAMTALADVRRFVGELHERGALALEESA
jgi:hypothetical protein